MKLLLNPIVILFVLSSPSLADEPLGQGRSVALCSKGATVCAYMSDGRAAEMNECQARHDQAVRILPGACWDAD